MRRPILVGYDPRSTDRAPVAFGVAAARFTGAPLVIACVQRGRALVLPPAVGGQPLGYAVLDQDLVEDAGAVLHAVREEIGEDGLEVELVTLDSTSAARALHEAAEERDAGLLVVGSASSGPPGGVLRGGTAERLMHGAPCPIAIVPQGWTERGRLSTVGVGYVDTDEGREALRGAHALARRAGAALRVITVVRETLKMHLESEPRFIAGQFGKDVEDVEGEYMLAARRQVQRAVDALGVDVAVEVDVLVGEPAEVLAQISGHLDLLVCGSRGYGPVRAVLLGSVSRRVTSEAQCPVIVLPRGVRASLEGLLEEAPGATAPA